MDSGEHGTTMLGTDPFKPELGFFQEVTVTMIRTALEPVHRRTNLDLLRRLT